MEVFRRPGVDVEGVRIGFACLPQDDTDTVMDTPLVVFRLHFRRDLVIGLGKNVLQFDLVGIVAKRFKGNDFRHCKTAYGILSSESDNLFPHQSHLSQTSNLRKAWASACTSSCVKSGAAVVISRQI